MTLLNSNALKPRILHIGFGAFARAHLAVYTDLVNRQTKDGWGITAVRLNSGIEALDALEQADCRYHVAETSDDGTSVTRIKSLVSTCHPKRDGFDALMAHFCNPDLAIVSLTITEKGYCLVNGALDENNTGIQSDLASPQSPKTAIGTLVEGLRQRRNAGLPGLSILSCDNLAANGTLCGMAVHKLAHMQDPDLAGWISAHVSFPSTMVDRIVPALDDEGRALLLKETGQEDPNGIVCEPFRQWVIEDDFKAGRPDWALAGAQFVEDVRPFEEMKLRMLNGSHSFIAYLGAVAGHEFVSQAMSDPVFSCAVRTLMLEEQAPTLAMPDGCDLDAYAQDLLKRFANSQLKHKTTQIASDGSQKLPPRLLASIACHMERQTLWTHLAFAVAGWMRYVSGYDENRNSLPVNDPLADELRQIAATTTDGAERIDALLAIKSIFPPDMAVDTSFRALIEDSYQKLSALGVRKALATLQGGD